MGLIRKREETGGRSWERYILAGIVILVILVILSFVIWTKIDSRERSKKRMEEQGTLAENIIRLHVVSNSDKVSDQELKIKIKDQLVTRLRTEMSSVEDKEEAENLIERSLHDLENLAKQVIKQEGYTYAVKASLGKSWFPVKMYGDMVFPQGEYDALKVELGKARGRNWWCVMFPTLCFVDETYQVVPDESKEKLQEDLTKEEYEALCNKEPKVTYRLRLVDWWNSIWN